MIKVRTLGAAALAAASLTLGLATASPASAATVCTSWNDNATYGATCSQSDAYSYFRAFAVCQNGTTVVGPWQVVGSGNWSYAYCSSVGSSLNYGGRQLG